MFRKTYTIRFKLVTDDNGMTYTSNSLYRVLFKFCKAENIDVKKIKIKNEFKKSYIKIKGTKEDIVTLYNGFFNDSKISECVETITPFKV